MSSELENSEDYLAKWLSGNLSDEDKEKFENSGEAKQYKDILNSVDQLSFPSYDVEGELKKLHQKNLTHTTKTRTINPIWRFAVAAVLVISIALVYYLTRPNYTIIKTTYGQIETITLPDNSVVTLNTNSTLKFNADSFEESRDLILMGEAFFEVTKGIGFNVETAEGDVSVLGTSFNVKQRLNYLEVQVHTGTVRVTEAGVQETLTVGDGLRVEKGLFLRKWKQEVNEKPLWITDNIIELKDVPLTEALESLENSFGIMIQYDISLENQRFEGSYPANNVEAAIQIVLSTNEFDYEYDSETQTLVIKSMGSN